LPDVVFEHLDVGRLQVADDAFFLVADYEVHRHFGREDWDGGRLAG
jgi:hypothetical protein